MAPQTNLFRRKRVLSFDIYGTLIDWETGLLRSLAPLISQLPPTHACAGGGRPAIAAFMRHETPLIAADPRIRYEEALQQSYHALAAEWQVTAGADDDDADDDAGAEALVAAAGTTWQPFPDTVAAMQALSARGFKLVALSNISHALWAKTAAGPLAGVHFDAVYVAEEIGSYKPDRRNFEFLLERVAADLGVTRREQLLHVGHGVSADQVPAESMGIEHAWIRRGWDNWDEAAGTGGVKGLMLAWETLGEMAGSVEREFAGVE